MNRRTFIKLSGTAVTVAPWLSGCGSTTEWTGTLAMPQTVARFCNKEELIRIGKAYLNANADEDDPAVLESAILGEYKPGDQKALHEFLEKKIAEEFAANQVVVVNGWVLARTEARQLGLFAHLNP